MLPELRSTANLEFLFLLTNMKIKKMLDWTRLLFRKSVQNEMVAVRWQQDKNGKEAWEETEGKSDRVHRGKVKDEKEI